MGVQPGEVLFLLSAPDAGSGYSQVGIAGNSLGKFVSVTGVNQSVILDNLFLDITGAENVGMQVTYQCLFVMNNTSSGDQMYDIFLSFPVAFWTPGGADLDIAIDPTPPSNFNSSTQQALSIATPQTAPAGISTWYDGPQTFFGQGCPGGTLFPQQVQAFWIRQTATNSPTLTPQTAQIFATYQTVS